MNDLKTYLKPLTDKNTQLVISRTMSGLQDPAMSRS